MTPGTPSAPAGSTGAALGLGALGGVVAVLPALSRIEGAGSLVSLWLGLAGGSALVLGPAVALLRVALERPALLLPPLSGVAMSVAPLALLGALLKAQTHHRPLGAATFAVLSLLVVSSFVFLAVRLSRFAGERPPSTRRALQALLLAGALGSLSAVLVAALKSDGSRPHVLDAMSLIVAGGAGFGALRAAPIAAKLSRIGLALWTMLVLAGVFLARGPEFVTMKKSAPVVAGPRAWL